jgi:hypothetical protein
MIFEEKNQTGWHDNTASRFTAKREVLQKPISIRDPRAPV